MYGSRDSEHIFVLMIDEFLKLNVSSAMDIAHALDNTIKRVNSIVAEYGGVNPDI
ncbi:MAG: hypothetical protein ACI9XC_001863 [Gammaproteobacteria bacterium]